MNRSNSRRAGSNRASSSPTRSQTASLKGKSQLSSSLLSLGLSSSRTSSVGGFVPVERRSFHSDVARSSQSSKTFFKPLSSSLNTQSSSSKKSTVILRMPTFDSLYNLTNESQHLIVSMGNKFNNTAQNSPHTPFSLMAAADSTPHMTPMSRSRRVSHLQHSAIEPSFSMAEHEAIGEPINAEHSEGLEMTSVLRKRRTKMNKHKLKKRRKRERFSTRKSVKV